MTAEQYELELTRVAKAIKERRCRKVMLQFPEGLKRRAASVSSELGELVPKCIVVVSGEPCYGACDIPMTDADLVVNFGHLPIPDIERRKPVLYIQAKSSADPLPAVRKALDRIPKKVGVVTTAQHVHTLPDIVKFLIDHEKKPSIGKGDGRIFTDGQLLGCNVSSAKAVADVVDCFLFVGSGNFHPLAVALATSKPIVIADPMTGEVRDVEGIKDRLLRQRHAAIELAKAAGNFGVILSTKIGQRQERLANELGAMILQKGKSALIVEMDTITPQKLDAFGLECWVSTACPRVAIDDAAMYQVPLLNPVELEIVLGKKGWEEYVFDEIVSLAK